MYISLLSGDVLFSQFMKTILGRNKIDIAPINNFEDFHDGNLLIDCSLYNINEVLDKCLADKELNKKVMLFTDDYFDKNTANPFRVISKNLSDVKEISSKIKSGFQVKKAFSGEESVEQELRDEPPLVLLADDSKVVRETVRNKLEVKSYTIKTYANGLELPDCLSGHSYVDLILLDNEMPVKDGITTLVELKSNPASRQIPALFLSGITDKEQIVKALRLGAADYISKPFDDNEFYARINVHLKINRMSSKLKKQNEHIREQLDKIHEQACELQKSHDLVKHKNR